MKNEFDDLNKEYFEDVLSKIETFKRDIENKNIYSIMLFVHKLKGSGSTFGFPEFTEIGTDMENILKDIDWDKFKSKINRLIKILEKLKREMYKNGKKNTRS
jgi:chemotaxis protein histidine kinase CheA